MHWCSAVLALILLRAVSGPALAAGARDLPAPDDRFCAGLSGPCVGPPYVLVQSAFPAEIEPLLNAAHVTESIVIDGRTYFVGTLGGANVILVRGGIGLVNAATTAQTVLARFPLRAMIFSGVAGSDLDIGDVAVPADWSDGTETFPVDASLLAIARTLTSPPVQLEQCTPVPPDPPGPVVCLGRNPRIVVGGHGQSADPFGGKAFPCAPGQGQVFGCDEALGAVQIRAAVSVDATEPDASDMETAAVARAARDAGVPFLAFRGVSDGAGDPLGGSGFPEQFFNYYRLSADNAAATAVAFLEAWTGNSGGSAPTFGERVGAACDWEHAVGACAGQQSTRRVRGAVARACGFVATAANALPGSLFATRAARHARHAWRQAARLLETSRSAGPGAQCRSALVQALEERGAQASP
jgi:nucleoside phosphorylase